MQTIAILTVFLPLLSGLINGFFAQRLSKSFSALIASSLMVTACFTAAFIFYQSYTTGNIFHYVLFNWLDIAALKASWAIYIDPLTAIMLIVVIFVSTVVHLYSLGYMQDDEHLPKFLSYLSLFTFFMLSLITADNFLQLFFGWEGVGLCSYLLIGYWYTKPEANNAAIKAFITNRVADFAFVLGLAMVVLYFNAIDFATVFQQSSDIASYTLNVFNTKFKVLDIICFLFFIGCMGKSAQIGLHVWLPDAMEGPTPVSALIHAATMVTAGVFLLARCSFMFEYSPFVLQIITIVGAVTCLFAATVALAQKDIKKIIAYSTCSQLGYMFLACGVSAYQAGIFHLVTHAFFKALLFLSAGSVIHACHEQNIFNLGGLKKKMPFTFFNFWIGSLAIVGIFPFAGYYSKDLILESAYTSSSNGVFAFWVGIVAAICTALYSIKIIVLTFYGKTRLTREAYEHAHESPLIMNFPLIILLAGALLTGYIGVNILHVPEKGGYFGSSIFYLNSSHHLEHAPKLIELLPLIIGISGLLAGWFIYISKRNIALSNSIPALYNLFKNKYYFDEIYSALIVKPVNGISSLANSFDKQAIDRLGPNTLAKITNFLGICISSLQTGYVFNYALVIILALASCITYFAFNFVKMLGI